MGNIGGAIEPGEGPREAARREVREEVGIDVELLDAVGGHDFVVEYLDGDRVAYVSAVFRGRWVGGGVQPNNDEVIEARWFPQEQLAAVSLAPLLLPS